MQELFDEFARMVATDTPKANSIVNSIVNKKIKRDLSGISTRRKKRESFSEFDSDTLYGMINDPDGEL
jgi:hypothetical protein